VKRRAMLWLAAAAAGASRAATAAAASAQATPRALQFPRDHGAHPEFGIEWWYATGWLQRADARDAAPEWGFQLTFFRSRTGLAEGLDSRFAARQLLFAHAALTDLRAQRLRHAERMARWNSDAAAPRASASSDDTRVQVGDWSLERAPDGRYRAALGDRGADFGFRLALAPTQPLLLQGEPAGFSRKGPLPTQASHYYSQPQLAVDGELSSDARTRIPVRGTAWLDHEWSGTLMPDGAVGWDWLGINLADGSALTAFRLRDGAGQALWSGGSQRTRGGAVRAFANGEVTFEPLAWWTSAATRARYPVRWRLRCPAGVFELRALLDAQELDARAVTGTVYWEGLSELLADSGGARLGLGYLEMTGYAAPLRL
jgi:predicted secreted hydrolase